MSRRLTTEEKVAASIVIRFGGEDAFEDMMKAVDGFFAAQQDGANKEKALRLSADDELYYLEIDSLEGKKE